MRFLRYGVASALSLLLCGGCAAMSAVQICQTLGGLLVVALQHQMDQVTESRERKELSEQLGAGSSGSPQHQALIPPTGTPTRVWVDEATQDGRVLAGHFETRPL